MIIIRDLNLAFGQRMLFDNISLTLQADQKIGLVGRNGSGKSTLLKIIAGQQKFDDGSINIERGKTVAYMPQEVVLASDKSVFDEAFTAFDHVVVLQQELTKIEDLLSHTHDVGQVVLDRYAEVTHEMSQYNLHLITQRVHDILSGLGFREADLQKPVEQLSVGWKMRLVLAKLLLQDADFYLFDEPTNHLDIVAKDWFLEFLKVSKKGFMLVSHDRYFLDHACSVIFELERGKGTLYYGNYSTYLTQKEQNKMMLEKAYEAQQKDIAKRMETINRFRAKASKAGMAQSMLKSLDKMERIEIDREPGTVAFSFPQGRRAGKIVLHVENVSKRFEDKKIFEHVSFEIGRDERVALVAANGVGKTTLLHCIMGKMPFDSGTVTVGHNVDPVLFEQDQDRSLVPTKTILDEVEDSCKTSEIRAKVRSMLGAFLFPGDDVRKKIAVLSGGEKNRVAMVKVLLAQGNFLLLDEPTNHLDLPSKDILLSALQQFAGTLLFVSHDRSFLDSLATRIIELTPTGAKSYPGNYESYLYQKKVNAQPAGGKETSVTNQSQRSSQAATVAALASPEKGGREAYEMRKKRANLENRIAKLEREIEELTVKFGELDYGSKEYLAAEDRLTLLRQQLSNAYNEWEKWSF